MDEVDLARPRGDSLNDAVAAYYQAAAGSPAPRLVLDGALAPGTYGVIAARGARRIAYELSGSFTGTLQLQGSVEGVQWRVLDSQTAPGVYAADTLGLPLLRFAVTAGSGTARLVYVLGR